MMLSYVGAGLHRVSQVTIQEAGLVLELVAAGQLTQTLRKTQRHQRFEKRNRNG